MTEVRDFVERTFLEVEPRVVVIISHGKTIVWVHSSVNVWTEEEQIHKALVEAANYVKNLGTVAGNA